MSLWPFRTADDKQFMRSTNLTTPDIYDCNSNNNVSLFESIRNQPIVRGYDEELKRYVSWRWQRGYLQSIIPVMLYCTGAGLAVGVYLSRHMCRYGSRFQIITNTAFMFGATGLSISAVHQYLVMRNKFQDKQIYPMIASMVGCCFLVLWSNMGTLPSAAIYGSGVGVCYTAVCALSRWYHAHYLHNFLEYQCLKQVPVSKITPELQPLYVAYLHDNMPIEEREPSERNLKAITMLSDEHRLDAKSVLANLYPEVYLWVNFPEWWPLKLTYSNEEVKVLWERRHDEKNERRTLELLENRDQMFRHAFRSKKYRD